MHRKSAVAYIRMSSDTQDASPSQQREEAAKLAALHGCRIIREYVDEGISGDNPKRPGFLAMLKDASGKRDFTAIICWDQDRFARFDSIKIGKYIDPLREAGVRLITKAQGVIDWTTFAGRMMYSIIQEGKHQYLLDLSRNVLRGRIASARRGQLIVQPAYGYDRVFYDESGRLARRVPYGEKFNRPRGWVVKLERSSDREKVSTVKWLMDAFANTDCSIRSLAKDLNSRGIAAPRGRGWNANTVRYILSHRVYLGEKAFGERKGGKYHQIGDDGEITTVDGEAYRKAPIVSATTHEALIDAATFERIQQKLSRRATNPSKPRTSDYLLQGILHCGHCGRSMCGQRSSGDSPRRYYRCPGVNDGRCKAYCVRKEDIEGYILGMLADWLSSPEALAIIEANLRELESSHHTPEASGNKARIAELEKKITRGAENLLLADLDNVPELAATLNAWKSEAAKLRSQAASTKLNGGDSKRISAVAGVYLKELRNRITNASPATVREAIQGMIAEITLFWESTGGRYRRLTKGVVTFQPPDCFVPDSSNIVFVFRPTETGGL